jgi:diguanylate cyclase (GGDEF)-like protein/putative nucleotidyltransferase with HDIG domain
MSVYAKLYIGAVLTGGLVCVAYAMTAWTCHEPLHYICLLGIALLVSGLKVSVPGVKTTVSVGFVFVLVSMIDFSYAETLVVACLAIAVQSLWRTKTRPKPVHLWFNLASTAIAVWVGCTIYQQASGQWHVRPAIAIAVALTGYFLSKSVSIAAAIALSGSDSLYKTWRECYFWLFPYYLLGGTTAALVSLCNRRLGWETTVLAVPAVYVLFRSYRLYVEGIEAGRRRAEAEKCHAEEMASVHLKTIEALALAIEAKDLTTHDHLRRVQIYAVELGKKLQLKDTELQALRTASILHDIGKLAVPEHIISKPGKLTAEEFAKMKIHPVVGAEILDRVQFPYGVVPIVRAHHERWDGKGYPDGLKGEEIPLGARILSVVDCLDALVSERQYRRAMPLDAAMAIIASEAGKGYDERIVKILQQNCKEWEELVRADAPRCTPVSKEAGVSHGEAPAAGLQSLGSGEPQEPGFVSSSAAARQEAQMLYELTRDPGNSLSLDDTLSLLDNRLQSLIPYDAIAVYIAQEEHLLPRYVNGENFRLSSSLRIPVGHGLSGWVAQTGQSILNGNPSVEPFCLDNPAKFGNLRSALAIRMENAAGAIGVLTLYSLSSDAFTKDHLRVLLALKPKVSLTIENALQFQPAARSVTTDGLTSLANARGLSLRLDAELAHCQSSSSGLAVLVGDLDGFRQVNDRFGRLDGDRALRLIAAGLRECCREHDYVARMGGDEFVLILPGLQPSDLAGKLKVLEKVVTDTGVAVCRERLLNISIGAAFCPEDGIDAEGLLAEADRRMHLAKQARKKTAPAAESSLAALAASIENAAPITIPFVHRPN